jgi:glucan biosynthesis protein C
VSSNTRDKQYLHEIDAVRGVLMALGILLHAANPYVPGGGWLVTDPDPSVLLGQLAALIHTFRMPGFFIVAGFFSAFGLARASRTAFLRKRSVRLLLPLLTALLVLNVPQYLFLEWWIGNWCSNGSACAVRITPGAWISHLWFLVYLMGYTVLLAGVWPIVAALLAQIARRTTTPSGIPLIVLSVLLAGFASVALAATARVFPGVYHSYFGFFSPYEFVFYLVFFALGVVIHARGTRRDSLLFPTRLRWYALGAMALTVTLIELAAGEAGAGIGSRIAVTFAHAGWSAVLAYAAIWLLVTLFRHENRLSARMAEAAYSVYLVHHLCIIVIAACFTLIEMPPLLEYAFNVTVTLMICLVVHARVVAPHRYVRLALNGA